VPKVIFIKSRKAAKTLRSKESHLASLRRREKREIKKASKSSIDFSKNCSRKNDIEQALILISVNHDNQFNQRSIYNFHHLYTTLPFSIAYLFQQKNFQPVNEGPRNT
jgi:hypothetical protein